MISLRAPARLSEWAAAIRRVRADYGAWHDGRAPDLLRPRRYTEKVQWRKLFDLNPDYARLSDKLAARDFIASRVGSDLLVPLLWSGADPEAIPFDALAPPYVLKSTHASGDMVIVPTGATPDVPAIRFQAAAWLARGYVPDEPAYTHVPRRLIIERQVVTPDGGRPIERKLFVFDGVVRAVNTVVIEDGRLRNACFHTPEGRLLDWRFTRPPLEVPAPAPDALRAMMDAASRIAEGFEHLRVDFYDPGDRVRIGEVTVYPWSGAAAFAPDSADFELGALWTLRRPATRALTTVLTRRRQIRQPR